MLRGAFAEQSAARNPEPTEAEHTQNHNRYFRNPASIEHATGKASTA
jgi:hypothetical protein